MACNCGGTRNARTGKTTLWQLKTSDGRTKKYATREEATKAQKRLGGTVTSVTR